MGAELRGVGGRCARSGRAGALLVPLNTRFKGAEAAQILAQSGARMLFTVNGSLGNDYTRLLDEAVAARTRVPELERVVVLRRADGSSKYQN